MSDGKEEAMIAGLTAEQHDALREGLRALPETMPPRAVWERIREQADAEGLLANPKRSVSRQWYFGTGLAAGVALVALILPLVLTGPGDDENSMTVPPAGTETGPVASVSTLNVLRAESSQLEGYLEALPGEPVVRRAGTEASINDITDRIAAIDYQLSDPELDLTAEEEEIFWRERVRLMKLLVKLRYAQTQRTAF